MAVNTAELAERTSRLLNAIPSELAEKVLDGMEMWAFINKWLQYPYPLEVILSKQERKELFSDGK